MRGGEVGYPVTKVPVLFDISTAVEYYSNIHPSSCLPRHVFGANYFYSACPETSGPRVYSAYPGASGHG